MAQVNIIFTTFTCGGYECDRAIRRKKQELEGRKEGKHAKTNVYKIKQNRRKK